MLLAIHNTIKHSQTLPCCVLHYHLPVFESFGFRVQHIYSTPLQIRLWSDLAKIVDETQMLAPERRAVHVHNELKIGDFLHFIVKEYIRKAPKIKGEPR